MKLEEIDENAKITLCYKDYVELKQALELTSHWLWKLRKREQLTDDEHRELADFMFKYFNCI